MTNNKQNRRNQKAKKGSFEIKICALFGICNLNIGI